ncbi:F0F1 ATP synthase subunit A [Solihabitans fulvus]|uniref:ATP synthase subunit a n=1 Tax=Solihabitans fulvus TaxID=1892852 RepID=A0A5B2X7E6_9PSEU|nr:F0F1 ATP synthase subunit A [Solihabitans fulvus]KAA2259428.1 F0F1 ATP synthase subunit A [Solihabitans fulvus]
MGRLLLAESDSYVAPGPQSFDYPAIFGGVTKPMVQIALSVIIVAVFYLTASSRLKLVPGKFQFLAESAYSTVRNSIGGENIARKDLRPYIPLLLTLFSFILVNNLFGFIPFFQLPTMGHIAFPMGLAVFVWLLFIFVGIRRHGFGHYFAKTLVPEGVPKPVLILYIPIEFFSTFIMRPVTLTARLFATMFAGHIMLLVFVTGGEYILLHASAGVKVAAPIAFLMAIGLSFVELLIQVLQAYVFTLLTANYIGGALAEGH